MFFRRNPRNPDSLLSETDLSARELAIKISTVKIGKLSLENWIANFFNKFIMEAENNLRFYLKSVNIKAGFKEHDSDDHSH